MAIVFPELVPDSIGAIDFPDYNPEINSFFNGDDLRYQNQNHGTNLTISFNYTNRKGQELITLTDFLREVRGGKSFILPDSVWKHRQYIYSALTEILRFSQFIIIQNISITTVRKNIYSYSLLLESVLNVFGQPIQSFTDKIKVRFRLPSGVSEYNTPLEIEYSNNNPNQRFVVYQAEELGVKKVKVVLVNVNTNAITIVGDLFSSVFPNRYPLFEVVFY